MVKNKKAQKEINNLALLTKDITYEKDVPYRTRLANYGGNRQFKHKRPLHQKLTLGVLVPYSNKRNIVEIDNGESKEIFPLEEIKCKLDYLESKLGHYKLEPIRSDSKSVSGLAIIGLQEEGWEMYDSGSLFMDTDRLEILLSNREKITQELKEIGFQDLTPKDLTLFYKENSRKWQKD